LGLADETFFFFFFFFFFFNIKILFKKNKNFVEEERYPGYWICKGSVRASALTDTFFFS
jgi:hypothetical protein